MGATKKIEDDIRTTMQTKRIRVTEFFKDFDRLRSGYITESQFQRCLDQFLGLRLTTRQVQDLIEKYSLKQDGMVNYRVFSEVIDCNFVANELDVPPEAQTNIPKEYLGTERSHIQFGPDVMERVNNILEKVQKFYTYHEVNVRVSYEDFDRHHNGLVTIAQFERNFPGPHDVSPDDVRLLAEYYRDPVKPNLTNYLNFHSDVEQFKRAASLSKFILGERSLVTDGNARYLDDVLPKDPDVKAVLDKIRVAVYKNGIRIEEFFKDHDKLRSGIITKNQFLAGLVLGCSKEGNLSHAEMEKIADYFQTSDGRIEYTPICIIMRHAFNVPNLEKQPTVHPIVPSSGSLSRSLNSLQPKEEEKVLDALSRLSDVIRKRQILLYPYFKDYDRGVAYTRNVTKSQFARVLHTLNLSVAEEDLRLLCLKFEEPISGYVNYPAFCQAVDEQFKHYTVDAPYPVPSKDYIPPSPPRQIDTSHVDLNEVIARIRHHVLVNRLRVKEYFEDFDSLRSGSVTKPIFERCLDSMGVKWLDEAHSYALQEYYTDPKKPDYAHWYNFMLDVDLVFTQPDLEKDPNAQLPPQENFVLPKEGTLVEWNKAKDEVKNSLDQVMTRMRSKASKRRILAKPVFQDFDLHNNGHVSRYQFKQCLAILNLNSDEIEIAAIEARYCDKIGFDYIRFLNDLTPEYKEKPKYKEHISELLAVNANKKPPEIDAFSDPSAIMTKIKSTVARQRMRVYEFMKDYDKLHTGRMLESNFKRSLDLAGLGLKESEIQIVCDIFHSQTHPGFIEYLAFSNEIESIFTLKNLEKRPLVTPVQYNPPVEWQQNNLSKPEEQEIFKESMNRLGDYIRKTRIQLFPLFEDYDRVHNGHVTKSQFHRVLKELEMGHLLNEREVDIVFTLFKVRMGGRDDINYVAFCNAVYENAGFQPELP